jgi:mannitol/fructose-specific phosphotransferase system IIA component (Ntr-type)
MDILSNLANKFQDEKTVENFLANSSKEEIYKFLKG